MSKSFRFQLSSIMEIMTKTAMEEICKIAESDFAFLQRELSLVASENAALKDQMLRCESKVESKRAAKEEACAGRGTSRSVCVQTEDGAQPSINGIFGKEWCSSLWDRRTAREDELTVEVDLDPVSPYEHKEQNCSNQFPIKEENMYEVDANLNYKGKVSQASGGHLHCSAYKPLADSRKCKNSFESDELSEISEIQSTNFSHGQAIKSVDNTVEQLMAPIEDPLDSDDHCLPNTFSAEQNVLFPSEAQEEGTLLELCGDTATTVENCTKRLKLQKLPGPEKEPLRPKLSCYDGKVVLRQNANKHRLKKQKRRPQVRVSKLKPNKKYSCEVCGRCFHSKANLIVHSVVHTGERPHKCSYCGKGFSQKGNLHTHERIHRGERPFTCGTCGKGFTQKVCLINHERIHRGERPFTCETCGKCFTQKVTLDQHLIVHYKATKRKLKKWT